jgi:hypothetical protein
MIPREPPTVLVFGRSDSAQRSSPRPKQLVAAQLGDIGHGVGMLDTGEYRQPVDVRGLKVRRGGARSMPCR